MAAAGTTDTSLALSRPSRSNRLVTSSVVQVTMGDDPGDRVASLSLTINAVKLTSDTGTVVPLISAPTTVEISSLAGTTTPLATVTVPTGTYTKAAIALGSATVTLVDPATGGTIQRTFPAPLYPFTIRLNPAFVSDGSALVINLDLDLHSSIAIDSSGNIIFNPLFLATHGRMAGTPTGVPPNPFTGGIERSMGTVTSVSGTNFTITTLIGQRSITFTTNSSTIFKGISGVSALEPGMLLVVGGQTQSDGTHLALGVMLLDPYHMGPSAVGLVGKTTGTPVSQFLLLVQGIRMNTSMLGLNPVPQVALTVNVAATTHFSADTDDVDMTGLSLTFDADSLSAAQHVGVAAGAPLTSTTASGTMMGSLTTIGSITAAQVRLVQQPLVGKVSNVTADSFTLTVPNDSVFAVLTKTNTVNVYPRLNPAPATAVALVDGQKVVVRGLLFNNSGYQMVATRIALLP